MTTPADFLLRVTEALKYMNSLLPAGSAVFFAPLVDGRVLYNTLGERTHPVGVKYREIYDYLNCLNTSPCWGTTFCVCSWQNFCSSYVFVFFWSQAG
jgi:acyloxyacyl hydrolase